MNHLIEPYYLVGYHSAVCNFEIFVNELPAFMHYEGGSLSSQYPINHHILRSGDQKIRFRVLPLAGEKVLQKESFFELRIFVYDASQNDYSRQREVFNYSSRDSVADEEVSIIENASGFKAEVPYTIDGWSRSGVIKEALPDTSSIVYFYQHLYSAFDQQHISLLVDLQNDKFNEVDTALYLPRGENESGLTALFDQLNREGYVLSGFPEKTITHYYAGDKVAQLVRTDNQPVIFYEKPITHETFSLPVYVHRPESSQSLKIIR